MRLSLSCLSIAACCALSPLLAQAQGVYAKAGILGAGLGYSHRITDSMSVRIDATTVGSISRQRTVGSIGYKAKLKADQLGLYGDWFPFANGFRLSAGMYLRDMEVKAEGRPNAAGSVTVNNTTVNYGAGDALSGRVKFPSVAPYLGLGWGQRSAQEPGFGFVFDLGVSFGKPKTTLTANTSLTAKLNAAAGFGATAASEIEAERRELARKANKLKVFPHLSVGVSYRF